MTVTSVVPLPVDVPPVRCRDASTAQTKHALWAFLQIEYSGFYSLEKLWAFQVAPRRTTATQIAMLLVATLPTMLVVFALELLVLDDPTRGWTQNPTFFVRETLRGLVIGIASNFQIQEIIPKLRQSWPRVVLMSFLQTAPYIGTLVCVAHVFDVFPVPFSNITPTLPVLAAAIVIRFCFLHRVLKEHPDVKNQLQRMEQLTGFVFSIVIIYSAYGFAFRSVNVQFQIVLSLVLPVIKYGVKHCIWKLSHVQAHHDSSAESIACSAHFFHALFCATCLQNARSYTTLAILLLLSVMQDVWALQSIHRFSCEVDAANRSFKSEVGKGTICDPFSPDWTISLLKHAHKITSERERSWNFPDSPIMVSRAASVTHQLAAWACAQNIITVVPLDPHANVSLMQRKARVTHTIAQLMHCREVMLLRMFVDIFVSVFYLAYVGFLVFLPTSNRLYFESIADMDDHAFWQLALHVAVFVACKLLALAAMCSLLRSRRQPSGLHQLAFVVSSQRWTMQPWFVLNVLQIINFPLVHMGNDLTFQFKWITRP